jgi:GNAT superfamily N-acetyltransferase
MAVLLDVEVPHQLRRQGLGTAAIAEFLGTARGKGARLAFLRVSWFGELSERDKMVSWYRRRGWQLLQIPPVPSLVVPFMYHEL